MPAQRKSLGERQSGDTEISFHSLSTLPLDLILQIANHLEVDEAQGFGSHLIAENRDHTLAVIITSWITNRETPPHDHDTWAVIGCVKGSENNIFWDRHDDKGDPDFADISRGKVITCNPGDIVTMKTDDIHSVVNPMQDGVSVSLHVYGKHFNHTNRKKFDPDNKTVQPFIVKQQ